MKNRKSFAAVILAVFVLAAFMTSLFVALNETDHDCIGDNCPVCAVLAVCRDVLKSFCGALIAAAVFVCFCFAAYAAQVFRSFMIGKTPISLKVKLIN